MHHQLPYRPNLEQFKKQAKQLLKSHREGDMQACSRLQVALPRLAHRTVEEIQNVEVTLREAQHVIAREYGLANWKALSELVKATSEDEKFRSVNNALSQTIWSIDLRKLIDEVESASEDMSELVTDEGEQIRIDRNPIPDMDFRLTSPSSPIWVVMRVAPVSACPEWYPRSLPFLTSQAVWIAREGKHQFVMWRFETNAESQSGDLAQRVAENPTWDELMKRLQPLIAQIREGSAEARKQVIPEFQNALADPEWGSGLAELSQLLQSRLLDASDRGRQFEETVREIIEQSTRNGWTLVEEKGHAPVKYYSLDKHGIRRDIQVVNSTQAKRIQLWDSGGI